MPPRLSKRQQRQLEEEALAAKLSDGGQDGTANEVSEGEQQAAAAASTATTSLFDQLGEEEHADELTGRTDETMPSTATATAMSKQAGIAPEKPATNSKKKSKSKKKKQDKPKADEDVDEIDAALRELDAKLGPAEQQAAREARAVSSAQSDPRWRQLCESLSFQPKNLDPDAELHKMFGRQVVGSNQSSQGQRSPYHPRIANNPHNKAVRSRKSTLVKVGQGWPFLDDTLETEPYNGPERDQEHQATWIKIKHTKKYKAAQLMFLEVLQQADGNRLFETLRLTPYHIDTLLQLGEMSAHQGDQGAASDFLDRALYAMSALLPTNLVNGSVRMAYAPIENRAIFLAVARKVAILVKRGTYKTALEWAKVGLSLGGQQDPVGMLLWIDFLATKCEDIDWFLSLLDSLQTSYPSMHIDAYPGLAFARALCLKQLEGKKGCAKGQPSADEALMSAALRFPAVVAMLSTAAGTSLPPEFSRDSRGQIDPGQSKSYPLGLMSEIYVSRSSPLWKEPLRASWLGKIAAQAASSLGDSSHPDVKRGKEVFNKGPFAPDSVPEGIERAGFLADLPSARPFMRSSLLSSTSYSFDPVPPSSAHATSYDDAYFEPVIHGRSRRTQRSGPSIGAFDFGGEGDEDDLEAVQLALMDMIRNEQEQEGAGQEPADGYLRRLTRMLFGGGREEQEQGEADESDQEP